MNILYLELIEAERRLDKSAEAAHYRLVKQVKQQRLTPGKTRILSLFSHLLEMRGCWLIKHSAMLAFTNRVDQTRRITAFNVGEYE